MGFLDRLFGSSGSGGNASSAVPNSPETSSKWTPPWTSNKPVPRGSRPGDPEYTGGVQAGPGQYGSSLWVGAREQFLAGQAMILVVSSWVRYGRFLADKGILEIGFLDGAVFHRPNTDRQEAEMWYSYGSKGSYLWDRILVRGKGNKGRLRCPFYQVR